MRYTRPTRRLTATLAAGVLAIAACGGDDDAAPDTTPATTAVSDNDPQQESGTREEGDTQQESDPQQETGEESDATGNEQTVTGPGSYSIDLDDCPTGYDPTGGISDTEIVLGSSAPQSGNFAAFAVINEGAQAYFDYVNEELGGLDGRTIRFETMDDGYEPARTVNNVTELIERQGIFATMGIVGTPNNLAVRDQLNEQCIPQLFATTGASEWGEVDEFPWTMGSIVSYEAEAAIYANYIQQEFPDGATVGLLVMNNDFGRSYQDGLLKAIEGTDIEIVEEQFVEAAAPSVANEITTLASSDADVLMGFVSGAICPQMMATVAQASWEPMTFLSSTCSSVVSFFAPVDPAGDGVLVINYRKDPTDPDAQSDPDMQLYLEKMAQYAPNTNAQSTTTSLGWALAALFVETAERAIETDGELTRPGLMVAMMSLDSQLGMLLDGISWQTDGVDDPWPIEQARIARYTYDDDAGAGSMVGISDVIDFRN